MTPDTSPIHAPQANVQFIKRIKCMKPPMSPPHSVDLGRFPNRRPAKMGILGMLLLWLLGIPIPLLILVYLLQGC